MPGKTFPTRSVLVLEGAVHADYGRAFGRSVSGHDTDPEDPGIAFEYRLAQGLRAAKNVSHAVKIIRMSLAGIPVQEYIGPHEYRASLLVGNFRDDPVMQGAYVEE